MIVPGLSAVVLPPLIWFVLGKQALGGFLAGATLMGVFLALFFGHFNLSFLGWLHLDDERRCKAAARIGAGHLRSAAGDGFWLWWLW